MLVTATRLARWKRVDRAVDAVALLRNEGIAARLLIVGDGEERTNLEEQVRDLGLQDLVTFVGPVPQPEVQRYLWAADVFLSTNELSNVGNPLLEAMIAGRCVLTLDEGDTRDLIRDGETGVLLHSGEPQVIADALAGWRATRTSGAAWVPPRGGWRSARSGAGSSAWTRRSTRSRSWFVNRVPHGGHG